jgi:hypothetical protein
MQNALIYLKALEDDVLQVIPCCLTSLTSQRLPLGGLNRVASDCLPTEREFGSRTNRQPVLRLRIGSATPFRAVCMHDYTRIHVVW